MPYTRVELENVEFYQEFIQQLRTKYLAGMAALSENDFRKDNVLYSFEDIFTGLGIEDVDINNSLYTFLNELDWSKYTTAELLAAKNDPDIVLLPDVIDKRKKQLTVNNRLQKVYIKTNNLESIIDRNITELAEDLYADELPEGMANGDVVKNAIAEDNRKWRIEGNQKRIFLSLSAFFGNGHIRNDLKTFKMSILKKIPNGDPIE
jgi:hypothetical protein